MTANPDGEPRSNIVAAEKRGFVMLTQTMPDSGDRTREEASEVAEGVGAARDSWLSADHQKRLRKDSRGLIIKLSVMGGLFVTGIVIAPEGVPSVAIGYYLLAVYAGWRFLNSFAPAGKVIELISKAINMMNGFFMPDWASGLVERAMTALIKLSVSMSLGVVLAPIEIVRSVVKLVRIRAMEAQISDAAA